MRCPTASGTVGGPPRTASGGGHGTSGDRIDWQNLMRLGLGALRLPPEQFWAMTPLELSLALEGAGLKPIGGFALDRGTLDRLMRAHPNVERNVE